MNPYGKYIENQILSASPEQILLMLYDGSIRFTRQAIRGIEEGNLADACLGAIVGEVACYKDFGTHFGTKPRLEALTLEVDAG